MKKKIIFLCTGNSCRSQMAEGFARKFWSHEFEFFSAGTKKHGLNQRAVRVMQEVGVDISNQYSKTIDDLQHVSFDVVVTVCDSAKENCPYLQASKVIHRSFEDPPALTNDMTNEDDILVVYRRVRDEIKAMILDLKSL